MLYRSLYLLIFLYKKIENQSKRKGRREKNWVTDGSIQASDLKWDVHTENKKDQEESKTEMDRQIYIKSVNTKIVNKKQNLKPGPEDQRKCDGCGPFRWLGQKQDAWHDNSPAGRALLLRSFITRPDFAAFCRELKMQLWDLPSLIIHYWQIIMVKLMRLATSCSIEKLIKR